MRPSRTSIPPLVMMPSSRNSGPTRGRAGPASVTTCAQLTTASVVFSFSEDINRDADRIRYQHRSNDLQREGKRAADVSNGNDREADVNQRDDETRRACKLEPPRRLHAQRLHAKQRNRKQHEIRQRVENSARVVDQLKRFLRVDTRHT